MKLSVSKFVILFAVMCLMSAYSEIHVEGRWVSTRIDNADDNGIGEGWIVVFRPDGTFSEEIDEGFGIVEEWEGTYTLKDGILSMQRFTFNQAWCFRIRKDKERLVATRMRKDKARYTVFLKQSDEAHPELSKLPKWPKSKEEAVSILKQKLSEEDLNKLADGTRNSLIKYHFGLGMYIRNAFGVWRGNKELCDNLTGGEQMHPDALSGIIIEALWIDLKKQRGNYEEYLALEELYNTLKIEAFPIRNMHPEHLVELLNEYVDRALQTKQQDPNDLNIKLTGVDPKSDARLNSLPLVKVWGIKSCDKVLLTECLMGFSRSLKTPNILELKPNYSGWYTRKDEKHLYTKVEYKGDYFDIGTEVSDRPAHLLNPLPAVYSCSYWSVAGNNVSMAWEDMIRIFFEKVEMSNQGKVVEFETARREVEGITLYHYAATSYIKPINDYTPGKFLACGYLTLTNKTKFQSTFKEHQFKKESKWIDYSVAPELSREEVIGKVTEYLKSNFHVTGQIVRDCVILKRAQFTDYWIYEVKLYYNYDMESNIANVITAHVLLNGDVVPFVKDED